MIVDAQLHAWAPESATYPWDWAFCGKLSQENLSRLRNAAAAPAQLIEMMDRAGVDGALLTSSSIYGADYRYAFDAAENFPGRFAVVGPIRADTPDVDAVVEGVREHPLGLGVRLIVYPTDPALMSDAYRQIYEAAERAGVPLFLTAMGRLRSIPDLVRAYPTLQIVLDHLGLMALEPGPDRLRMLPDLLALGQFDKIAVKCTAAPELSREAYPFGDLSPVLREMIDAFGAHRLMWGSDFTQHNEDLTYEQALDYLRRSDDLSVEERDSILGTAAEQLFGWVPRAR